MGKPWMFLLAACVLALTTALPVAAQGSDADPLAKLPWQVGPTKGQVGNRATIDVPDGYVFLGADGTRKLNDLMENPPTGADEYTIAPQDLRWFAYFTFDEVGYVKDDDSLDAEDLLSSIKKGTEQSNEERRSRGWDTMTIDGWSFKPQYDKQLNSLEWAILAHADQSKHKIVNYNTRLLGRRGVMQVIVVSDPEGLDKAVAQFKSLMPGYAYNDGEKYAQFKEGDHIAEYGLAALVTGGAAAVASKKGFFAAIAVFLAKMWKLLLIGLVAVGAAIRKLFSGKDSSAR
ncbi:DUF2167 domain-containing protein [Lysobacter sp.]|uniref:DUF2167 domain-containing protein n=1 Tax=Lysobacter sp. TaxID=72226 RepID=UPI002D481FD0|nr:DUF2167 domain-containing protein [Lysobacter sp.]HZX75784.1 DUF2167 domain-containing protein [Lysobacter sp.]